MPDALPVNIVLKGEVLEKFNQIKEHIGLQHATEAIRFCISQTHDKLELS